MGTDFGNILEERVRLFIRRFRELMSLRDDTDQQGTLETIRANVDFRSANAWTLVFAILIASIGLNTNSAAVIIGAMLISPLMGPIVGAGLGLGINDLSLVKRSLTNLSYAVAISLAASFLYFAISPLSEAQSELLARTRPTFFDALIAIFGGAAGIVALSRKEKSNAIPGVAIATALMPPLCTAGYALSQGKISFFLGAMYMFLINSVYICLATLAFIRYLGFPRVAIADAEERRRMRHWITATALLVLIPSLLSAWLLLRESSFRSRASSFVKNEMKVDGAFVVGTEIAYDWRKPKLIVSMIGEPLSPEKLAELRARMRERQLPEEALEIQQSSLTEKIEQKIKSGLATEQQAAKESELLRASLELQLNGFRQLMTLSGELTAELQALFPRLERVTVVPQEPTADASAHHSRAVLVQWKGRPSKADLAKINDFLTSRLKEEGVPVSHLSTLPK